MIATCVYVQVKPEFIDKFIEECVANHNESVKEDGNVRFDVMQQDEDRGCFLLYEAYESEAAAAAHKSTDHYKTWRNNVEPMMAVPRKGVKHQIICPKDKQK